MKYLLDSNVCVHILRHPRGGVAKRFFATPAIDMAISIVTKAELLVGPHRKNSRADEHAKVNNILGMLLVLPFNDSCAEEFGVIAARLLDQGSPGNGLDVQIAATARVNGLIMVTNNTKHFCNINGLQLEDWQN